jgi:hypothetical protein
VAEGGEAGRSGYPPELVKKRERAELGGGMSRDAGTPS